MVAQSLAQQVIKWHSLVHELVISKGGHEIAVLGADSWRCYDPWHLE